MVKNPSFIEGFKLSEANILLALSKAQSGVLRGMEVHGRLRCLIKPPKEFNFQIKNGWFGIIDVLALRCLNTDYFAEITGVLNPTKCYTSTGSLIVVTDRRDLVGRIVKVLNSVKYGCSIKKQYSSKNGGKNGDIVGAFNFRKGDTGWVVESNYLEEIKSVSIVGLPHESIVKGIESGIDYFGMENSHQYKAYMGVEEYTILDVEPRVEVQEALQGITEVKLAWRDTVKPFNEVHTVLDNVIQEDKHKLYENISNQVSEVNKELSNKHNDVAEKSFEVLVENANNKVPYLSYKGVEYIIPVFESYIERIIPERVSTEYYKESYKNSVRVGNAQTDIVPKEVLENGTYLSIGGISANRVVEIYFRGVSKFPVGFFTSIANNPYKVALIVGGLSFKECEKIFMMYGCEVTDDVLLWRDGMLMKDVLTTKFVDTLVEKYRLVREGSNHTKVKLDAKLAHYVRDIGVKYWEGKEGYTDFAKSLNYFYEMGLFELKDDSKVVLLSDIEKEMYIYRTLWDMANESTGISQGEVDEVIKEFESEKGFSLEKLQSDGVSLVKHRAGVLSGCAGSGKTTVSECMVKVLERYMPGCEVLFGAPTGKAARRLAEVVGGTVKTLHSMFRIGVSGDRGLIDEIEESSESNSSEGRVYIFDEMAMCTTDLLYQVLKRVSPNDCIYFLGDIKQLPPIGRGVPFKEMMNFLPVVELGVSKRSAEGSIVNYNCNVINQGGREPLRYGEGFTFIECVDQQIPNKVLEACRWALERWEADDIQVVTSYADPKKGHSSSTLNPILQGVFSKGDVDVTYRELNIYKGDRLIHRNANCYDYPRYRLENGIYVEVEPTGVVNGETLRYVRVCKRDEVRIQPWEGEDRGINVRRDDTWGSDFLEVATYDVDIEEEVRIFYHCRVDWGNYSEEHGYYVYGKELDNLDIAYALTTHKMQGSQGKCIIIPIGGSDNARFVNRNMVYTAVSRASKEVILVGSKSMLSRSLKEVQGIYVDSFLGDLCK